MKTSKKLPPMHLSLNQAENLLDGRELDRYCFAWLWSTGRFSHPHDIVQERYIAAHGSDHFWSRVNQVRKILGLIPYSHRRSTCPNI